MNVLKEYASYEFEVKKSRFLAEAFVVNSQPEVRKKLKALKEKYQDATHVVHAFVIGKQGEVLGCSDDGEPSGTAGKPALNVLKNSGVTNIFVSITRWFGGTLLGTGGLVKAYSEAVQQVLAIAKTYELIETAEFSIKCDYNEYENLNRSLSNFDFEVKNVEFTEKVVITGSLPETKKTDFCNFIVEITRGNADVKEIISTSLNSN